jgi:hypothetical protein
MICFLGFLALELVSIDVVGDLVEEIRVSYRVLRIPGIQGVDVTLAKGKKPTIEIQR